MNMTAIAIVAICCWALAAIVEAAKSNKKHKISQIEREEIEKELHSLSSRVETLERIVTDESYTLKKEFDNLKSFDGMLMPIENMSLSTLNPPRLTTDNENIIIM